MMHPQAIPTCAHTEKGVVCGAQAMPNTRECPTHWRMARGWDEANACYPDEDAQPFEAGDEDTQHWTDELEAIKQA